MNHPSELISAYLDGQLTGAEIDTLTSHLAGCGKCAAEMQDVQRVRAAVRSLPLIEVPVGLVPEGDAEVIPLHKNRGVWVGAAAATVAVVIAVATVFSPAPSQAVTQDDLTSRFAARVSLDPAFGPAKVVGPNWEISVERTD